VTVQEIVLPSAGDAELRAGPSGLAVRVAGATVLRCASPVLISVLAGGAEQVAGAGYSSACLRSNRLVGRGQVRVAGVEFGVEDVFTWSEPGLRLSRRVRLRTREPVTGRAGFASALRWAPGRDHATDLQEWFLPGCVYRRNEYAPPYAIGARLGELPVHVRADRLALPVAAWRDPASGLVAALLQDPATATAVLADDEAGVLICDEFAVGSFGDLSAGELGFGYPGSEGTVSYPPMWTAGIGNSQSDSPVNPFPASAPDASRGWARRYHPVRDGGGHAYELVTMVSSARSFPEFVLQIWRSAWSAFRPRVREADLAATERVSLDLLAASVVRDPGALSPVGIPTWIDVFTGRPGRLQDTFSIGFVGRNLEAGYVLLRAAERHDQPGWGKLGREIIDFWVRAAGSGGLCHTEWDRAGGRWADSGAVYLRDQSEARTAVLAASGWLRCRGEERQDWLGWCVSYGDWLAGHVAADGSLCRSYRLDGTVADRSVNDGIHAAAFLARLFAATGEPGYLGVAERIAGFYLDTYHLAGIFAGGTLDNPNCYDREAASLAMEAYLALHEVTGEPRWLAAAMLAADFCESWIVGWDIPMRAADADTQPFFDPSAPSSGLALITLGFSAVDTYLARHVGDFLALAAATGDDHYREVAALVLHNTKQMVQLGSEYGYVSPGYQIEHWAIGRGRGYGLNSGWLPWVSTSHILSIWAAEELRGLRGYAATPAVAACRGTWPRPRNVLDVTSSTL
jgi:hypothetical protein